MCFIVEGLPHFSRLVCLIVEGLPHFLRLVSFGGGNIVVNSLLQLLSVSCTFYLFCDYSIFPGYRSCGKANYELFRHQIFDARVADSSRG